MRSSILPSLFEGGEDLRDLPLTKRKERLQQLLSDAVEDLSLRFVEHFETGGAFDRLLPRVGIDPAAPRLCALTCGLPGDADNRKRVCRVRCIVCILDQKIPPF
jgi:hypothetical protein